jgi:broad specificity phosphatase PhoE
MLLYLIRHGKTDFNAQGRVQGHLDIPLNADGVAQAGAIAARLRAAKLSHIYASPLLRAAATAQTIANDHSLTVTHDERLREYDMGDWQGRLVSDIRAESADGIDVEAPNGETALQMHTRMAHFLDDVLQRHDAGARIAIASHGGTLTAMVSVMLELPVRRRQPFTFSNVSLSIMRREPTHWKIIALNDVSHVVRLP